MTNNEDHHRERSETAESFPQVEMNMEIAFSLGFAKYHKCGSRLVLYKTERKIVISLNYSAYMCNRRLIFVHFRRNKIAPCPCRDSGHSCTVWRCGE